jgi:hypothetical protein
LFWFYHLPFSIIVKLFTFHFSHFTFYSSLFTRHFSSSFFPFEHFQQGVVRWHLGMNYRDIAESLFVSWLVSAWRGVTVTYSDTSHRGVHVPALLTPSTLRLTCCRYNTAVKRYRARRTLGREIEAIFLKDTMVGWLAELEAAGCIAGSVAPSQPNSAVSMLRSLLALVVVRAPPARPKKRMLLVFVLPTDVACLLNPLQDSTFGTLQM